MNDLLVLRKMLSLSISRKRQKLMREAKMIKWMQKNWS